MEKKERKEETSDVKNGPDWNMKPEEWQLQRRTTPPTLSLSLSFFLFYFPLTYVFFFLISCGRNECCLFPIFAIRFIHTSCLHSVVLKLGGCEQKWLSGCLTKWKVSLCHKIIIVISFIRITVFSVVIFRSAVIGKWLQRLHALHIHTPKVPTAHQQQEECSPSKALMILSSSIHTDGTAIESNLWFSSLPKDSSTGLEELGIEPRPSA